MAENITVDPKDAEENKIMAILAYLGFPLVLVPILAAKESPFARFHANQGLVMCIALFAICTVAVILGTILAFISVTLALAAYALYSIAGLVFFVFMIMGILNVIKGEAKELPIIGKYTIIK